VLCATKSKFIRAQIITLMVLDTRTGISCNVICLFIVPLVNCAITKRTKNETQQDKTISQYSFKGKKQVFQLQPCILPCSRRRRGAYLTYLERSTGKNKGVTAFKIFCTFRTLQQRCQMAVFSARFAKFWWI
jgi:hypothetical protein